MIFEIKID